MTTQASIPNFASDNWAPAHPEVMAAVERANRASAPAYGEDPYTAEAAALIREHFGQSAIPYFVFTGTGANVLALQSCARPHETIIASDVSHIHTSEWGAVEYQTRSRIHALPTGDGKIAIADLREALTGSRAYQRFRPRVVSLTQATEYGTIYKPDELVAIADATHAAGAYVHMDGARLANAAASLGLPMRDVSTACGVDVLSFGATKNGAMCAEVVVFMRPDLAVDFDLRRKQGMQLASKMRFNSVQVAAMLSNELWLRNASHANAMAQRLASSLAAISGVTVTQDVEANEVFVSVPGAVITPLRQAAHFHVWQEDRNELRLVCSFNTTHEEVDTFVQRVSDLV